MKLFLFKLVYRASFVALSFSFLLLVPIDILARVGGGQSYGGGRSGGSGGSDDGGAIAWLIFELIRLLVYLTIEYPVIGIPLDILFVTGIVVFFYHRKKQSVSFSSITDGAQPSVVSQGPRPNVVANSLARLRKFDPNFSEIVFTDFAYALYGKAHEARGRGVPALDLFSPYLSEAARKSLLGLNPPNLQEVKGIIVGSMQIGQVDGLVTPMVRVSLIFEANYTEVVKANGGTSEMSYYVTERWELERKRDLLSPPPAQATALHCPRCGAPLQRDTVGACAYCGTKIESGEFQWYVRKITSLAKEARGPLLTSDVPEVGTDLPSVVQPDFDIRRNQFNRNNPAFSWTDFQSRAKLIFDELQAAWSSLNWERARPHETDNIFQMHQYWIDAYQRQGLRNVIDNCTITSMQQVKIQEDAFYQAITLRIRAQGKDYTVNNDGKLVAGSRLNTRKWSEYWTFIRNRNAKSAASRTDLNCPNCGSPLKVNAIGICEFCGGKITSGEFDWVLSKIEQDESYAG
jgi:Tim44-like domain